MSGEQQRDYRDRLVAAQAQADQNFALWRDDDTLLDAALGFGAALKRFVEVAAERGMDRVGVFGITNGMLLAAVDHRLPPTPVGGQTHPPKEET